MAVHSLRYRLILSLLHLFETTRRLQEFLVRVGRYDIDFQFIEFKGTNLVLADDRCQTGLILNMKFPKYDCRPILLQWMMNAHMKSKQQPRLTLLTMKYRNLDMSFRLVSYIVDEGCDVSQCMQHCFDFRYTLSYCDSLVMKCKAVFILIYCWDITWNRITSIAFT